MSQLRSRVPGNFINILDELIPALAVQEHQIRSAACPDAPIHALLSADGVAADDSWQVRRMSLNERLARIARS